MIATLRVMMVLGLTGRHFIERGLSNDLYFEVTLYVIQELIRLENGCFEIFLST